MLISHIDKAAAQTKMTPTIQLSIVTKSEKTKSAVVKILAKAENTKAVPAKMATVNFYSESKDGLVAIQKATTDNKGYAEIGLPEKLPYSADSANRHCIVAKIENDSKYEDAAEKILFKDISLTVQLIAVDSARTAKATLMEIGADGNKTPVKSVDVKFYAKRMYGDMPLVEDNAATTDDAGIASFDLPKDLVIPGNENGDLTIVAKVENNEQFGTIENSAPSKWGKVTLIEKDPFPRALWEPRAPWGLVFTFIILFGGIWSTYLFMILQLRKVKKETA
jgi:hypothetical protein